jgi:hypothetical protein
MAQTLKFVQFSQFAAGSRLCETLPIDALESLLVLTEAMVKLRQKPTSSLRPVRATSALSHDDFIHGKCPNEKKKHLLRVPKRVEN